MSCLDPMTLADYWAADLDSTKLDAVEEHLLACDACSRELQRVAELAQGIATLARRGELRLMIPEELLHTFQTSGLQVRRYDQVPGGTVYCTITAQDDLLIAHLTADLAAAQRIDLLFLDEAGALMGRAEDIPFRPERGEVFFSENAAWAKTLPANTLVMKLLAVAPQGERTLAEYTFHHTPTP